MDNGKVCQGNAGGRNPFGRARLGPMPGERIACLVTRIWAELTLGPSGHRQQRSTDPLEALISTDGLVVGLRERTGEF